MASNTISILIKAQDNASKVIRDVGENIDGTGKKSAESAKSVNNLNDHMGALAGVTAGAGAATYGLIGMMNESIGAANRYQAAITGLTSVARAYGHDTGKAKLAAQELARDGLMTVTEAATGLKNLLASGFSLDEAVTLMHRFKDSAAFGRQSALGFGQAVASATEGIKNGNSILVDNAGVTKNLSVILREMGKSEQDVMNITSDASVRRAIFNGILKETNAQAGDAARLAESAAGKQAVWAAQTEVLNQKIGMALQPALLALLQVVTPIVTTVADWISKNPELAAGIILGTTAVVGLTAAAGALGLAVIGLGPVFVLFKTVALASFAAVGAGMTGLTALIASPIVMPAIAVGAALAALATVISKAYETISVVGQVGNAIEKNRGEIAKTDAAMKRALDEGRISNEKYQQYIRNTQATAENTKSNLYSGFFGPLNQSFDNLFARLSGSKEKFKGSGFGGFATGTAYAPGGLTLVGENGPELVNLPRGSQVTQAYRTRNELAQEGAGGVTNILSGNFTFQNAEAVQAFFNRLDKTQRLAKMGMAS